jgi:CHAP domain
VPTTLRSAPGTEPHGRAKPGHRKGPPRAVRLFIVFAVLIGVIAALTVVLRNSPKPLPGPKPAAAAVETKTKATEPLTLGQKIAEIAESQVGYTTNPGNTYCNKYSAYWLAGSSDCGNSNLDEEWCADFAAWVWQKAGALVTYQFINGDINSSAASFYEWGVAHNTWHPAKSGYIPQPGDVAVYGLDAPNLVASHVAVVIGYQRGDKGPNVVNGDGDKTAFSAVEQESDQFVADASGQTAYLSGYTSPTPAS